MTCRRLLPLAFLVFGFLPAKLVAQDCYLGPYTLESVCASADELAYYAHGSRFLRTVSYGNVLLGVNAHYNGLDIFNLNTPESPALLTAKAIGLPWTVQGEGTHGYLIAHIKDVAVLDGFRYALVQLGSAGWDLFDLDQKAFLKQGLNPVYALQNSPFQRALLFSQGGTVYAVAQSLNQAQLSSGDRSVYLYVLSSATVNPTTVTASSISGIRVPIGRTGDPSGYEDFPLSPTGGLSYYRFATSDGRQWLIVKGASDAVLVEITNPLLPIPRNRWKASDYPKLFKGEWAVESAEAKLYVADNGVEKIYGWDLSQAPSLQYLWEATWHAPISFDNRPPTTIAANGSLIVVGAGRYVAYLVVGNPTTPPSPLAELQPFTYVPDSCAFFQPTALSFTIFSAGGQVYVSRSLFSLGDIVALQGSCLQTIPSPSLSVPTSNCSTGGAAAVFPGDTVPITNASTGPWLNPQLWVKKPGDQTR